MSGGLYLGVDLGGTSVKAVLATGPQDVAARLQTPTSTPAETLAALIEGVRAALPPDRPLLGLGVSCFGPVDRDPASPGYGRILTTPKPGWSDADILGPLRAAFSAPADLDTDVNGALLGEAAWGAAQGLDSAVYVTIGTGVGGGILERGRLVGAPGHPELGHMRLRRLAGEQAAFPGVCPFHGDCVEGLVSAPALTARWGAPPHELADDDSAWSVAAHDLAQLCLALTYSVRPQRIILGGGVSQRPGLIERAGAVFLDLAGGYSLHEPARDAAAYIVRPALDQDAGALGAIRLAQSRANASAP